MVQKLSFSGAPAFTKGNKTNFGLVLQMQLKVSKHCMNARDFITVTSKIRSRNGYDIKIYIRKRNSTGSGVQRLGIAFQSPESLLLPSFPELLRKWLCLLYLAACHCKTVELPRLQPLQHKQEPEST